MTDSSIFSDIDSTDASLISRARTSFPHFMHFLSLYHPNFKVRTILKEPYFRYLISVVNDSISEKGSRMIVNLPPRHGKSQLISVILPAWLMGNDPKTKIGVASYNKTLAEQLSLETRNLMRSKEFSSVFNDFAFASDQDTKDKFATSQGGMRIAMTMRSFLTGFGFDYLMIDDAHDPIIINERDTQDKAIEWFNNVISRLDPNGKNAIFVVGQRLHARDLTGYLLQSSGWRHVSLPLVAQTVGRLEYRDVLAARKETFVRRIGQTLSEAVMGKEAASALKEAVGSALFNVQYQQETSDFHDTLGFSRIPKFTFLPKRTSYLSLHSVFIEEGSTAERTFIYVSTWRVIETCGYLIKLETIEGGFEESASRLRRALGVADAASEQVPDYWLLIQDDPLLGATLGRADLQNFERTFSTKNGAETDEKIFDLAMAQDIVRVSETIPTISSQYRGSLLQFLSWLLERRKKTQDKGALWIEF